MFSDTESLAFAEEEPETTAALSVRPSAPVQFHAGVRDARPPLHGGSPVVIYPTKKPAAAQPVQSMSAKVLRRSNSVASASSIAFHVEDTPRSPVPSTLVPQTAERRVNNRAPSPAGSIAFQVEDTPINSTLPARSHPSRGAAVNNDSIAFETDDELTANGGDSFAQRDTGVRRVSPSKAPRSAILHRPAAGNDSIAFHFEDDMSLVSERPPPQKLIPGKQPAAHGRPVQELPNVAMDSSHSSLRFEEEEDSGFYNSKEVGKGKAHSTAAAPRKDASFSSIQFSVGSEAGAGGDGAPPLDLPPRPLQGNSSFAGSSVSAVMERPHARKTVVSNHLKRGPATPSPPRVTTSTKVSPQTHPPLYQERRAAAPPLPSPGEGSRGSTSDTGAASTTGAAAAGEAVADAANEAAGEAAGEPKRRRKVHKKHRSRSGHSQEQRRSVEHSHAHRRHRSRSGGQKQSEALRSSSNGSDSSAAKVSPGVRKLSTPGHTPAGEGRSDSVPSTARTQKPSGVQRGREEDRVLNHLEDQEVVNEYHREGHAHKRMSSAGLPAYLPPSEHTGRDSVTFMPTTGAGGAGYAGPLTLTNFAQQQAHVHMHEDPNGAIGNAVQETQEWRAFNEQQRAEIERLKHRIATAQRQDRTVLGQSRMSAGIGQRRPLLSPAAAATSPRAAGRSPQEYRYSSPIPRKWPSSQPHASSRQKSPTHSNGVHALSAAALARTADSTSPQLSARRMSPSPTPRSQLQHNGAQPTGMAPNASAASAVADLLGIVWPPTDNWQMYFVTGSRLTRQQMENFYDTVRVQQARDAAEDRRALAVMSPSKTLRAPSSARSESHRSPPRSNAKSKGVKRSQVLRDLFDLMDQRHRGHVFVSELPVLQRLFEQELVKLDAVAQQSGHLSAAKPPTGKRDSSRPLSLLEAAAKQHDIYVNAYAGLSRGLVVASSQPREEIRGGGRESSARCAGVERDVTKAARRVLLLSFAVNVVLPLAYTSHIGELDFPTLAMIVFGAVDKNDRGVRNSAEGQAWRQIVAQYFEVLS